MLFVLEQFEISFFSDLRLIIREISGAFNSLVSVASFSVLFVVFLGSYIPRMPHFVRSRLGKWGRVGVPLRRELIISLLHFVFLSISTFAVSFLFFDPFSSSLLLNMLFWVAVFMSGMFMLHSMLICSLTTFSYRN